MYDEGQGVPQDYALAVQWYRRAAEQGYAPAQVRLGKRYAEGRGSPQDFAQAYFWFNLAAASSMETKVHNML
jgi:TPR repeat protein